MPVVLTTWEAEAGGLLESQKFKASWVTETLSQKEKKN
jgi:hypothetical protein